MDYELWKKLKRETKDKCVYIDTDTPLAKKNNSWAILSVEHPAEGNCFRIGLDDSKNSIGKFLHENWDCFDYLQHKTKDDWPTATNDMTLDSNKVSALSSYIDDSCSISCSTDSGAIFTYNPESDWVIANKISTSYIAADNLETRFGEKADKYLVDEAQSRIDCLEVEFKALEESLKDVVQSLEDLNKTINNKDEKKEKNNMFKFDFGSCAGNEKIAMSMYGLAIRNEAGVWVSYDANTKSVIDVDILNFRDMNRYIYKMPIAMKDIAVGDMVIHNKVPMFVNEITPEGKIVVIDIYAGEEKIIMPTKSPFGFNFITKVISLFDGVFQPASKENPFGNMWMFAMLSDGNFDMKDMLMFSMMTGNNIAGNVNPMMLMAMADSKDKANDWILPMMLMNGGAFNQSKS